MPSGPLASPVSETTGLALRRRLGRIVRSFGYAFEGLETIVRTQPNFWVHVFAACLALALGVVLSLTPVELAMIVLCIALVLVVESVNTGIETMCDLISPGHHPQIKRAKDISAAAVLIAAAGAVILALLLYGPRLVSLLR
jgi:diacylglycerol kinase (ATP)